MSRYAVLNVGGLTHSPEMLPKLITHDEYFCPWPTKGFGFRDRFTGVLKATQKYKEVLLIGSSAGGLATLAVAAASYNVVGVIAISPATPWPIIPNPWECQKRMWRYYWPMIRERVFNIKEDDYGHVALNGLSEVVKKRMLEIRYPVSGREARELALPMISLGLIRCPVIIVTGSDDRWVSIDAQKKLVELIMQKSNQRPVHLIVKGAGHMPCHTGDPRMEAEILEWVRRLG